jgi:hypothetical protein
MDNQRRAADEKKLERHSLPGTNMAGKGPEDECESDASGDSSRQQDDARGTKPAEAEKGRRP